MRLRSRSVRKQIEKGDRLLERGALDEAEALYRQVLASDPDSAEALYSIGCVASHRQDAAASVDWALRALAVDPQHAGALALAGDALIGLGRHAEALPHLEAAEAAAPSDLTSVLIALCLEAAGELEEAEDRLRRVLADDPGYRTRHDAVAMYSHNPVAAEVHANLARVLQRSGDVAEARLHYHLAKRTEPLVELDPMYLEIMSREELEDHPIDREMGERWADFLDLTMLGEAAEPVRAILALTGSSDVAELEHDAATQDAEALVPVAADLSRAAQANGWFRQAATVRVVGDCLSGDDVSELYPAVRSSAWQRLLEIGELLHDGTWSERDALLAAARAGPPPEPELLVRFATRFVVADAGSGLSVARVLEAALERADGTRAAVDSSILVGHAWANVGDHASAEAAFAKAVEQASAGGHADLLLSALDRLGMAQGERGRVRQAVETLTRHVAEADRAGDAEAVVRGRYNLAVALGRSGRPQEAYETAVEAAVAVRAAPGLDIEPDVAELVRWAASEAGLEPPPDVLGLLAAAPEDSVESLRQAAGRLYESGRMEEALAVLDQAGEAARAEGWRSSALARILHLRAGLLGELGRTEEARAAFEAAIEAAPPGDGPRLLAVYRDLAAIHDDAGRADEAIEALETALGHARRLRSLEDEVEIRARLAALVQEQDPERARYHYGKAARLAGPAEADGGTRQRFADLAAAADDDPDRALGRMVSELAAVDSPPERRDVAFITGMAALDADRPDLAEQPLLESLALATSDDWRDAAGELSARQALGTVYRRTGRYSEAIDEYRSALRLAERVHDEVEAAEVRGRLAIALRYADRLDEALAEYRLALTTFRRYDLGYHIAVNQMNLAQTLILLGRNEEAAEAALEALALFDEEGESELALRTLHVLAESAAAEDLPPGLHDRLDSEAFASRDPVLRAWSAVDRASRLLHEHDVAGAERELERATEIYRSSGDRFNEAMAQLNRARLLAPVDQAAAVAAAEAARRIAIEIGQGGLASQAEGQLLRLAVFEGDDAAVDRLLSSLVATWAEHRRALQHDRDRIALADQATPLLKLAAAHFLDEGRFDRAFEVLDLARAQGLTDALVVRAEAPVPAEELLPRLSSLLRSASRPAIALTLDVVGGLVALGTFRAEWPAPKVVDTGVTEADVERMLENFRTEMLVYRGHGPQTWPADARRLLAPVAGELRDGDLVFLVLDGDLQLLPLHAVDPLTGASVVHVPSFAALELSRNLPRSRDEPLSRFVSVGVSFPDEARAVGLALEGSVLSGRSLSKEVVREAVADATIVHFACHGFFDTDDFLDSGLLLSTSADPSRDEVLSLRDLVDWRLHADLVVLSACETGLGKAVPSDFLGLGRGILAAGARAVIVSLWPVEDAATQELMLELYRTMAEQRDRSGTIDVGLALSAAQRRFAESRRIYDWAAFKLVGWPELAWSGSR